MRIILLIVMMLVDSYIQAQLYHDTLRNNDLFIRLSATGLVDVYDMNITVGIEKRFRNEMSAGMDVGWIFFSRRFDAVKNTSGILLRPSLRYFPGKRNFYVEGELHFKNVFYQIEDWIGRSSINEIPAYEQYTRFEIRKNVIGPHLKIGRIVSVSHTSRLLFDFYLGIGVHFRKFKIHDEPGDSSYQLRDDFTTMLMNDSERLLAVPAGVKVVYRLR